MLGSFLMINLATTLFIVFVINVVDIVVFSFSIRTSLLMRG